MDNDSDSDFGDETGVQIGYLEPVEKPLHINASHFPSKVGGKPMWLNPKEALSVEDVQCGVCQEAMYLLLQLYTPFEEIQHAYHRYLYVYICANGACHQKDKDKPYKVWRSQLPKNTALYDKKARMCTPKGAPLCILCGVLGSKICSRCHAVHYCSKAHHASDWSLHKSECKEKEKPIDPKESSSKNTESNIEDTPSQVPPTDSTLPDLSSATTTVTISKLPRRYGFKESEILSEEEILQQDDDLGLDRMQIDSGLDEDDDEADANDGVEEDLEDTQTGVDKAFLHLQKRLAIYPDQVLRYNRLDADGKDPAPLYVSDLNVPSPSAKTLACHSCDKKRTFEFQIMSTVLNSLGIDHSRKDALDFGTLLVYTCPDLCDSKEAFTQELILGQDFSSSGMQLDRPAK